MTTAEDTTSSSRGSLLHSWTPVTTKNLQRQDALAFDVLDHVLMEDFCQADLQSELSPWLSRMKPARTQGDVKMEAILALAGMQSGSAASRGDKSIFIGRDERSHEDFPTRHPCLSMLIDSFQKTAQHYLSHCVDFDFSLTSAQLAVYPGDGQSGYPKHTDHSKTSGGDKQRILTMVYYLTPQDWSAVEDGGCLRLFSSNETYYDVVPYSNRVVVFRSDLVEHQVLPSLRQERMALTVWLYGKDKRSIAESPTLNGGESTGTSTSLPPPLPISNQDADSKIFVAIAAYRDSELVPTLNSLFTTAQHPDRVTVGVVLQINDTVDRGILDSLQEQYSTSPQVKILQLPARHARGPCFARDLCQRLYDDEDFVLQTDSHMRFRPNWDSYLIQQLQACPEPTKSLLTTYPVGYQLPNQIPNEIRPTILVPWKFDDQGMLRQRGRLVKSVDNNIPCLLYAAGFNFGHTSALQECPYDGRLSHLFFGEELSMAVRLYTHGYNLYAPPQTVCYHLWSRAHRPAPIDDVIDEEKREEQRKQARQVILEQLRGTGRGLGTERTVTEFAESLGVDFETQTLDQDASLVGLQPEDFVDNSTILAPQISLEQKVQLLDPKSQAMIASFLSQLNS